MKLRRILACALAIMLVMSMFAVAGAAPALVKSYTLENCYVTMNVKSNTLAVQDRSTGLYTLLSADGTALTTEPYIVMNPQDTMFEVAVSSGDINIFGMIDAAGQLLVPMQYGDVVYISDRWQMGVVLEEATAENYDYKSFSGDAFYLVSGYDVYYCGTKVGTLDRLAYNIGYAYGDYLYIRDVEGNYYYYDSTLTLSPYASSFASNQEYEETKDGIWHRGSGQQAFTAGCTLTADNVKTKYYVVSGRVVDLQGNELGTVDSKYESTYAFHGDYAMVRANGMYGLIDYTGREVLACEYESLSYGETYFEGGYQIVIKDGKVGFVNPNGEVTCEFKYASGSVSSTYKMPATSLTDLEGNIIILSGAAGELATDYTDAYIGSYGCTLIPVEKGDDLAGVIDLYGNEVIALDGSYDDLYDFTVSNDGTLVMGSGVDRVTTIYNFSESGAQVPSASAAADADIPEQPAGQEPVDSWVCDCGQSNTGKFCSECGGAQPAPEAPEEAAEDGSWTCGCGQSNTGKFCSECGTARPAEKLVCGECGFEPAEGEAPKFCSECGAAF